MSALNGSRKWPDSHWRELLRSVLPILAAHRPGPEWWSFGGGTALAVHLGHRISYDIDIFLDSTRDLRALTPNANPLMKAFQGELKYEYPGNYLKLYRPSGEIDIIVAAPKTDPGVVLCDFDGIPIQVETPVEIAVKKIFYRPSTFKVRDVFDVAAVLASGHETALSLALGEVADRLDLVLDRLAGLAGVYEQRAAEDINPTESGRRWLKASESIEPLLSFLEDWRSANNPQPG